MSTKFTVLIPVHRNAVFLPLSMRSVLWQTNADLELFIVCDGAPADTVACAKEFASQDERVRVFEFPKGVRHGEAHRDVALASASGKFVAHLCDDDLWFPNHLEEMEKLLNKVDFGNILFCLVDAKEKDNVLVFPGDLANPAIVQAMKTKKFNFFGPTTAGYTMEAYRKLAERWSPAPLDIWTDLYMWRKFLNTEGLKFGTRMAITSCHFPSPARASHTLEQRKKEMEYWFDKIQRADGRDDIVSQALGKLVNQASYGQYLLAQIKEQQGERVK